MESEEDERGRGRRKRENRRIRRGGRATRGGRCERREVTKIESGGFVVSFRVAVKGIQRFGIGSVSIRTISSPLPPISAGEQNERSREISRSH